MRHHVLTSHFEKYAEWHFNQLPEPPPGVSYNSERGDYYFMPTKLSVKKS